MRPLQKRLLAALVAAVAPAGGIILLAQTAVRRAPAWDAILSAKILGVEFGFLLFASGPVFALVLLGLHQPVREYLRPRLLAIAILAVGLAMLWDDNPLFAYSAVDALERGGFSLWGRLFISLVAVAAFVRLTRGTPAATTRA